VKFVQSWEFERKGDQRFPSMEQTPVVYKRLPPKEG